MDDTLELQGQGPAAVGRVGAVHDDGHGVHGLGVDEHVELDQVGLAVVDDFIVQGGEALGHGFETVEEVVDDLREGQLIADDHACGGHVAHVLLDAALLLAQPQHVADIVVGDVDLHAHKGFGDGGDLLLRGQVAGIVDVEGLAVGAGHPVDDRRGRGDELGLELALQALLDDLHVE